MHVSAINIIPKCFLINYCSHYAVNGLASIKLLHIQCSIQQHIP